MDPVKFMVGVAFWLVVFRVVRRIRWKVVTKHGK